MTVYFILGVVAILMGAFGLYVRFAPSDPAVWQICPIPPLPATGQHVITPLDDPAAITTTMNSARAFVWLPGRLPEVLQRLDKIAMATPRTVRLAGSPEGGRITWVTRSALWGFPDYTTAEAGQSDVATADIAIFARSRFGRSDFGVNAARLKDWLSRL
ncbi:DUF1499 domain-containing protein [Tabrizicola sp.]|uniref:DUF1499 domain-containing protein n=1 Tax=Tabrizicola sp. TaxID=2005166 RepID=UPI003F3999EC